MTSSAAAILAQVVKRYRQNGSGVSELSNVVEELASSNLTEHEIAQRFQTAFEG